MTETPLADINNLGSADRAGGSCTAAAFLKVGCGVVWCGVVRCGVLLCDVVWPGVAWCGLVWFGVVHWCGPLVWSSGEF